MSKKKKESSTTHGHKGTLLLKIKLVSYYNYHSEPIIFVNFYYDIFIIKLLFLIWMFVPGCKIILFLILQFRPFINHIVRSS